MLLEKFLKFFFPFFKYVLHDYHLTFLSTQLSSAKNFERISEIFSPLSR